MRHHRIPLVALLTLLSCPFGSLTEAADKAAINQSIAAAANFLRANRPKEVDSPVHSLVALALLKADPAANQGIINDVIGTIRGKISNGVYNPPHDHIYEAASDAMLLADAGEDTYTAELQAIANYLISVRFSTGGWDYPEGTSHNRGTTGDTSVTQYACLGLWAAARAGIEIPPNIWNDALVWALDHQNSDGGYAYVPGTANGKFAGESDLNMSFAGMSVMLIAVRHLYPADADTIFERLQPREVAPAADPNDPFADLLQEVDTSQPAAAEGDPNRPTIDPAFVPVGLSRVRAGIDKTKNWINTRFRPFNDTATFFPYYYLYTVERVGALANTSTFGGQNWYDVCSAATLAKQTPNGSFEKGQYADEAVNTSFVLLFLIKSTAKTIGRPVDPPVSGGLLTGGRGDPGAPPPKRRDATPLDELLQTLQNPGALNLEEVQTELVEKIQIGDRSELIGQKDLIVRIVKHPDPEIRRTAVWALGRTNDLSLARHLIDALEDQDAGVMMEAHAALSWLSRRFDGAGLPFNPLDEVPDGATDEVRQSLVEGWRDRARREWGTWYLKVRPYKERGDEFEAQLRQRLGDQWHPMPDLTHFDDSGASRMVDVGDKPVTRRTARAEARVIMRPATLAIIRERTAAKGDVLEVARLAGIMAAKRTAELIPLCHSLGLDHAEVQFDFVDDATLRIETRVGNEGRTGVEMEALTAASVAALTVYDMCKAVDRGMEITGLRLLEKTGGRSGHYPYAPP